MLKVGGAVLLVLSGLIAGQVLRLSYVLRTRQLGQVKKALIALSTEIACTRASLPVAFRRVAAITDEPTSLLLAECARQMDGLTVAAGEAWRRACLSCFDKFCFGPTEREVLLEISSALGLATLEEQLKRLEYARQRVEFFEQAAFREEEHAKLWSYGGFAAGAVTCLLLL
ncbi:MAG TPA: hypothetical protein GXX40_05000 [Firmicutes bacterium]|nr:hypothetical protein [Bacillota bacterium]